MTPEKLIEQVESFGSAWAAWAVACADDDPEAAARFAGESKATLLAVKTEIERQAAALAAVEQDRKRLSDLAGRLVEELEDLAIASCWTGNFKGCNNGGCAERRALLAEARVAIAAPLTDLIGIAPDRDEDATEAGQ